MKTITAIALLFSFVNLCVTSQVSAEVVYANDRGFKITNSFTTSKTEQQVWQALVYKVDAWWPKDHSWWGDKGTFSIDPTAGGCFCEKSGKNSAEHMHIAFVEHGKLLRMTGGLGPLQGMGLYGALDWKISSEEGTSTVTLTYTVSGYYPDGYSKLAVIVDQVQAMQLGGLAKLLGEQTG